MTAKENSNASPELEKAQARQYHVVWDRKRSRYHVIREDGLSFGFSGHKGGAIGIAMRAAIKDSETGIRPSVHVQQRGGLFKVEWEAK
jgi:hypothetical protein